jgi:hypothetical protein
MMSGIDHAATPAIDEAAAWLPAQPEPPRPLVRALRERIGLTPRKACAAAARVQDFRQGISKCSQESACR